MNAPVKNSPKVYSPAGDENWEQMYIRLFSPERRARIDAAAARALARQDAKAARIAAASKPVPSARMVLEPSRSLYANLEKTVNLSVLDAGYAGKVLRRS
ncbi:hypothetical protein FACS1894139_09750 [Planctomycetales bacterium]|nr:hypothetical protein FACS1894107_00830 [Planctomycetales bacterium]GHT00184.1 hypothetical protein FACS1894108_11680 [Planctomycetales bacterium]GHT05610.1 hypothetical protein FACS1894139_09750 [Planctomycetales bacterium]